MVNKKIEKREEIVGLPGAKNSMPGMEITNKTVYLIVTEDALVKAKVRAYVASKFTESQAYMSFRGAEISHTQIKELSSYDDAIELANKNKSSIEEMIYPWNKICSIKNITYRHKGKLKGE